MAHVDITYGLTIFVSLPFLALPAGYVGLIIVCNVTSPPGFLVCNVASPPGFLDCNVASPPGFLVCIVFLLRQVF